MMEMVTVLVDNGIDAICKWAHEPLYIQLWLHAYEYFVVYI